MATLEKYTWVRGDLIPQEKAVQPAVQDDDDMTSYERELGVITTKMEAMEASVASLHADLREVRDFMRDAKSGWKVLTVAGGIGGAIAAAVVNFVPFLLAMPK